MIPFLILAILLGPAVNYAIYQFAYFPRPISPWQRPGSRFLSFLPVVGWLFRFNDRAELGTWFWLRPMLIELLLPVAYWLLYQRVMEGGLVPSDVVPVESGPLFTNFLCLATLFTLLVIATFIDFDERTIPDLVTVPGTLIALIGSVVWPDWRLREIDPATLDVGPIATRAIHANSSFPWPEYWSQNGTWGLALGLLCWLGWCFALLNRQWILRRGWKKAWIYFWVILGRDMWTRVIGGIALFGGISITITYFTVSPDRWESLLSALMGIGLGGMLLWSIRLVSGIVMGKEALGFGDVTLMAMVGAFVGWQVVWISFFVSPFFALLFVIVFYLVTRDTSTPFGPYLSMAVVYVVWDWVNQWYTVSMIILPPELLVVFWGILLVAMAGMLGVIEFVKRIGR